MSEGTTAADAFRDDVSEIKRQIRELERALGLVHVQLRDIQKHQAEGLCRHRPSSTELSCLRIILRAVTDRCEQLQAACAKRAEGVQDGNG